jgi:hypothetical protein
MAFVWGRLLALIIRKNDAMSRLTKKLWQITMTLYPENFVLTMPFFRI